uniref:Probable threonine protease PRSS50 n=1 Tax=Rhinopithecus bieti TaxID=61621 RepID=A0A2K6KA53_RHIBE
MGPWCQSPACGQRPRRSAPSRAGCWGAGEAPRALSTADPADQTARCAPKATCPSGPPRLPQQAPTTQTLSSTTMATQPPVSEGKVDPYHSCGFSYEQDLTLRDPEAMARRWPWMVSVRANGTHICAGTIIASQWVLTVAHCLTRHDVIYSVRVGSPWIDQMTQTASDVLVLQVIVHSRYRAQRFWSWVGQANDIGLLKLKQALKYSKYVRPICLPGSDYVVKDHSLCTVTGWGLSKADGMWPQFRTIQEKEVIILNNKDCDNFYHNFTKIPTLVRIIKSQMICAEDTRREQFCYELTGEPLVCSMEGTWYLVGLVSWGAGCQKSEAPPIYLHISSYQNWIWDCLSGQALALPAPSRALLLALPLPLSLLAAL